MSITVTEAHEELAALKRRLFVALGERRDARIRQSQAQSKFDGTISHLQIAREFIQQGLRDRANPRPKIEAPYASPLDRKRASGYAESIDSPGNPRRRGYSGLVRGSVVAK
jgi:hypothetical protein